MNGSPLRPRLQRLAERIDALSLRERGLAFITVMAVIYLLALNVLFAPLRAEHARLEDSVRAKAAQVQTINSQVQMLLGDAGTDAEAPHRQKVHALEQELAALDRQLEAVTGGTVSPQEMARLLEQMLVRNRRLELIAIESLPPVPALERVMQDAADARLAMIYRHAVRLEFRGRYFDIVEYLKSLEALPWKVYWGEIALEAERYPRSRVTLVVHTLSRNPGWMGT